MTSEDPERRGQPPGDIVAYRLAEIEKRLDSQAKEQARGFADVAKQISALTFVRLDVYASDQRNAADIHASLRKDIDELDTKVDKGFERADTRINWSHAVIGVAVLGAIVTGIARLAGLS